MLVRMWGHRYLMPDGRNINWDNQPLEGNLAMRVKMKPSPSNPKATTLAFHPQEVTG